MRTWIFFDLGSTIINETEAEAIYDRHLHSVLQEQGVKISYEDYVTVRQLLVKKRNLRLGGHRSLAVAIFRHFTERNQVDALVEELRRRAPFDELRRTWKIYRDVRPTLNKIAKEYYCGVIANQDKGVRDLLYRWKLASYFKVLAISGELGVEKPDARIFRYALKASQADPVSSVMVGDRVDNDMGPAKRLKMKTVRIIRSSIFSAIEPSSEEEIPDKTIDDLRSLPDCV
jgi:HAD superfamily hydrolase (TIGR01549 family)